MEIYLIPLLSPGEFGVFHKKVIPFGTLKFLINIGLSHSDIHQWFTNHLTITTGVNQMRDFLLMHNLLLPTHKVLVFIPATHTADQITNITEYSLKKTNKKN